MSRFNELDDQGREIYERLEHARKIYNDIFAEWKEYIIPRAKTMYHAEKTKEYSTGKWCDTYSFVKACARDIVIPDTQDKKTSLNIFKKLSVLFHPDKRSYAGKLFLIINEHSHDQDLLDQIWNDRDTLTSQEAIDEYLKSFDKPPDTTNQLDDIYYAWFTNRKVTIPMDSYMKNERDTILMLRDEPVCNLIKVYLLQNQNWINDAIFSILQEKIQEISIYECESCLKIQTTHRVTKLIKDRMRIIVRKMYEDLHPATYMHNYVDIATQYGIIFDDLHVNFRQNVKDRFFQDGVGGRLVVYNFLDTKLRKYIDTKFTEKINAEFDAVTNNFKYGYPPFSISCTLVFILRHYKSLELTFMDQEIIPKIKELRRRQDQISSKHIIDELETLFKL